MVPLTGENQPNTLQPPSILVLARNEQEHIAACLRCMSFSNDVVVLDACSTDRTAEIAGTFPNVRLVQRAFDTQHQQLNHALHEIEYNNPWLYICEADELLCDGVADEITRVVNDENQAHAAYELRRKQMYMGKWLKRAAPYPVWQVRLVRPSSVRYEAAQGEARPNVVGSVGRLQGHFMHYGTSASLRRWFDENNASSDRHAIDAVSRPGKKHRAFRTFFANYLLRGGILEGLPGLHYCANIAMFEYWIEIKVAERRADWTKATEELAERMLSEGRP